MTTTVERLSRTLADRYRIERELGAGGMATVYLAADLKHDRRVAIKVLKPELAAVLGAERFVQEIKTTAALSHPHILPLFDSGTADGFLFYVMPYIQGETIREKLNRETQLGIDEAVKIAAEVADALDYAHRHGVIHRDIKPENILLHDGRPMVMDFGIALAVSAAAGGRMTETGLSLGTPHYMSPEQATADKDITARSDIYSLASVLYEMLAGEPPHMGNSAQQVIMKIVTDAARPVTELRKSVPPNVGAALAKALEKLPADRFETAASFAAALANASFVTAHTIGAVRPVRRKATLIPWALLAAAVIALLYLGLARPSPGADGPVIRASLNMAANQVITGFLNISNDGRLVALEGTVDGVAMILIRDLSEDQFRPLPNSDGGELPFFSPDGSQVLFRGSGALLQAPTAGGPASVVDSDAGWGNGDWAPDGTLYYPRSYISGLWRKSPDGVPEMVTQPDSNELSHWHPQVLPGGRHVLFTAFRTPIDSASIAVVDVDTRERRTVLRGAVHGRYVPTGHLVYARENTIFAIAFDAKTMETSGRPAALLEDVKIQHPDGLAFFSVSDDGTAVYVRASEIDAPADLVWVDRAGNATPVGPEAAAWNGPALSPGGRSVAVAMTKPGEAPDVWVLDLARGARSPLTVGGGADFQPIWTPDGDWIIYASETPVFDLFRRRADGSAPPESLVRAPFDSYPFSFTPDGSRLLFQSSMLPEARIKSVALDGSGSIETVPAPAGEDHSSPSLSPDGRLLAFTSEVSGHEEVYVASWPGMNNRQTVSLDGGTEPRWTKNGRELVFRHGNEFLAVDVDPGSTRLGTPQVLFTAPIVRGDPGQRSYDVTADGERFIMVTRPAERASRRVMVITNFFDVIERMVPR